VKLRYSDFNTFTKQMRIPYTSHDRPLIDHALNIFERLYERRQLVRLIGIRFSGLVHGSHQLNLFEDVEQDTKLLQAMDKIRKRWGNDSLGMK